MEGAEKQEKYNKGNEVTTFSVPFALTELKEGIAITTNTPSKEQIIDQAFKFHSQGNILEAIKYYRYCINQGINDHRVYTNYGSILKDLGNLEEAEISIRKAIFIKDNDALAHSNLGIILRDLGNLEEAAISARKAIKLNPYSAEGYSNLGIILRDLGNLEEAERLTYKAIKLKSNFSSAAFNLYGLANNIQEAEERIIKCLKMDKNHLKAKLTLSALKLHQGDRSLFEKLKESTHKDHPYMRSISWILTLPNLPKLFFNKWALFDHIIKKSKKDRPFIEFGVCRGVSFKYLMNSFTKGYGFDTFEGLPEKWHHETQGRYSADGIIPKIDGGEFLKGKFEDTLPTFFTKPRSMASIINFDADLYSSTICALTYSKPVIDEHTILIFDEFIMNDNWEEDEYKALNEFCDTNNLSYKVIAISYMSKQVAVRLSGV